MTPNELAFQDMIGISEGTTTSPLTKNAGYDVIVTGIDSQGHPTPEIFTDYSHHPFATGRAPKVINSHGLTSTASGKVQILFHWWSVYQAKFHWPTFAPEFQDAYYLQILQEQGARARLAMNDFYGALQKVSGQWASLPGKAYVAQHQHTVAQCAKWYVQQGGTLVEPPTLNTTGAQAS
jgi:muramidase (phage lysozyme)